MDTNRSDERTTRRGRRVALRMAAITLMTPIVALGIAGFSFAGSGTPADPYVPGDRIRICHATGNGGYVANSPSLSSDGDVGQGHGGHEDDIIPSFWFKQNANAPAQLMPGQNTNLIATWANNCVTPSDDNDEVDVQVALGTCQTDGETSWTRITASFTGDGSATVDVTQDDTTVATLTASQPSADLPPGSYAYSVSPATGSELAVTSDTSDTFVVNDCTPGVDLVDVQVSLGACQTDGETSWTPVSATFTGDGSASVDVKQGETIVATLTAGNASEDLAPGSYTYVVNAATGSALAETSDTTGELGVEDCTPRVLPLGSVAVTLGQCDSDTGESLTPVSVTIAPEGAANVVLSVGDEVLYAFDGDGGSEALPPGTYTWTASASSGFSLVAPVAGVLNVDDCPSIVLSLDPLTPGGPTLPKQLAKTGPSIPMIAAMALWLAVAGLLVNEANRRVGRSATQRLG